MLILVQYILIIVIINSIIYNINYTNIALFQ